MNLPTNFATFKFRKWFWEAFYECWETTFNGIDGLKKRRGDSEIGEQL